MIRSDITYIIQLAIASTIMLTVWSCHERKISFNREVRPILNRHCISCHGGVKQAGGFGLIFRENALKETRNGKIGIVPGHPEQSEMITRINHTNPELRMPQDGEALSAEEINLITQWIEQGAQWERHWAYDPPKEPAVPSEQNQWGVNPIDHFILKKMEANNLQPSSRAPKPDLIRRVYLDLIGLPPTADEIEDFLKDDSEQAYEVIVDKLLNSPRYGEHWASMWLDLARYADTRGYEKDLSRQIWQYRDWVIRAFNEDKPFDQFTIEQLAGDLLPNPTKDQLIATAFHRNTLNNDEGGTYNEEYRVATVIDRSNTTWEVWQSTTMGCAQCHSHPYDPIKQKEYFASFAFFNNTVDWDVGSEVPLYREFEPADEQKLNQLTQWIASTTSEEESQRWERLVRMAEPLIRPEDFSDSKGTVHHNRGDQDYMVITDDSQIELQEIDLERHDVIYMKFRTRSSSRSEVIVQTKSESKEIGRASLLTSKNFIFVPIELQSDAQISDLLIQFESEDPDWQCQLDGFLLIPELPPSANFATTHEIIGDLLNKEATHTTPVMMEKPLAYRRTTQVMERGNWLVKGEEVDPAVPQVFGSDGAYEDRLAMSRWLVSDDNPLTARVTVNRFWSKIFGRGIVPTVEDFGTLGDLPSHPELLDWLAIQFSNDYQWSLKKLLRTIVTSATYQQSSAVTSTSQELDPENIWLSRSPRVRLSAEQIRDQALAVSGLLSDKMYGPSVMPVQPDGVWNVVYSNEKWVTSQGEDAYRRGLYTFLRRTSPYPSFITFDAASREFCLSSRINTNTPLQALVTLNDPVYVEAARKVALEMPQLGEDSDEQLAGAYKMVMGKAPDSRRVAVLKALKTSSLDYYENNLQEAHQLARTEDLEMAANILVANAIMNLDEFIMKN